MDKPVALPVVDAHNVRWFSNQVWQWTPHLKFFDNNLTEHLRKTGAYRRKTYKEIQINRALYHKFLLDGKEVEVNGCKFKLEGA